MRWSSSMSCTTSSSSSHISKKRSKRQEECSGPIPWYPCGRRSTSPDCTPHLFSMELKNWSMITCAPLEKSPNCASHSTNWSSVSWLYPSSNPSTPNSESGEDMIEAAAGWFGVMLLSGVYVSPVFWSCRTACRWLKVPRSESCPLSLTCTPSIRRVPKAIASAVPQSMFWPSEIVFSFAFRILFSCGCNSNPSGRVVSAFVTWERTSDSTPVLYVFVT
mmetsp:Transcript_13407/g.18543  ORF Transcript_13407/g.18543 Transcript_13407/m.18543 type:complete len:219 (+) Transcript_13407:1032-1688(+)